jgi:hypothetical protein
MRIFVVHDEEGAIRSVVQAVVLPDALGDAAPRYSLGDPAAGERSLEIAADTITDELTALDLQENYRVDVERGALVRKDER